MNDASVLLVVDIQNDFCPEGALAVPRGHEVVLVAGDPGVGKSTLLLELAEKLAAAGLIEVHA